MTTSELKIDCHPIQLVSVAVKELYIRPNKFPELNEGDSGRFSISVGKTDFNDKTNTIGVALKLEVGTEKCGDAEAAPYEMRIELLGTFEVNTELFKVEFLEDWSHRNAPYLLFPYLREQAYALSSRCGFSPMILPLFQVPATSASAEERA